MPVPDGLLPVPSGTTDRLPGDVLADIVEAWEERAAIIEHEGQRPRKVAETLAALPIRLYFADVRQDTRADSETKRVVIITHNTTLDQMTKDLTDRFGPARLVRVWQYEGGLCLPTKNPN